MGVLLLPGGLVLGFLRLSMFLTWEFIKPKLFTPQAKLSSGSQLLLFQLTLEYDINKSVCDLFCIYIAVRLILIIVCLCLFYFLLYKLESVSISCCITFYILFYAFYYVC